MFSLKNKTVFLTGSTGGIGKEIAFQMSSLGAKLVITGTNEEKLKDLSSKLPNENDYIVSNLDNSQNIENLSNQLSEKGYSIDILINNAGITRDNLFLRMKEDEWSSGRSDVYYDENEAPEPRNLYNEGLGFAHIRRLEQENEMSRANTSERQLKLIGSSSNYIIIY